MDPSTGAIKKKGSPLFYYPRLDDPKKKYSFKLEIKHVCDACRKKIEVKIENRQIFPLWKPKNCIECSNNAVKYAYAVICTICSQLLNLCSRCLREYNEYGDLKPVGILLLSQQSLFHKFQALPLAEKRIFLKFMFRKWKKYYKKNKVDENEAERSIQIIHHELNDFLEKQLAAIEAFNNLFLDWDSSIQSDEQKPPSEPEY